MVTLGDAVALAGWHRPRPDAADRKETDRLNANGQREG